jgi:hypothetical protein
MMLQAPTEVNAKLSKRFMEQLPTAVREHTDENLSGVEGPTPALFFSQEELNYQVPLCLCCVLFACCVPVPLSNLPWLFSGSARADTNVQ